jgi:DnaK suppressor protein
MLTANKESYRKMLKDFKKSSLSSSKTNMKNLMSGESRLIFGSGMEEGDLAVRYQSEHLICKQCNVQRAAIKEIEAALERLDEGSYGICDDCGTEITEDRLKIVPFTKCCRDCQEDKEKTRSRQ